MHIRQFRFGSDNLAYLLWHRQKGVAIDAGAVDDIISFIQAENIELLYVTNTHGHPDHTCGNSKILKSTSAQFLNTQKDLMEKDTIQLADANVHILHTPGHTRDSYTFHFAEALITGDTLFNGTVGNCFSGNLEAFYHSIQSILKFPAKTRVYAGHDYVRETITYAKTVEPNNPALDRFLQTYSSAHVYSDLATELRINLFARFDDPAIIALLEKKGFPRTTPFERWVSLMENF